MAISFKLKRRASGLAGAPAALLSGEPAHNEVDDTLYIGVGDNGSGEATSVKAVAGSGAFVALTGAQTVGGAKTFSVVPRSEQDAQVNNELVRKSQFDVALFDKADTSHSHFISDVTGLQGALDAKAPIASPTFTGTPSAPTPTAGNDTTQIATTAFVQAAVTAGSVAAIGDIGDVTITAVTNLELMSYDSVTGHWINRTAAEAGLAAAVHNHTAAAITSGQIPVAHGGTGASTEAAARTALGLAIGSDVQAYSAILAGTTASFTTADETKIDHITVTQAVDLDTISSRVNQLDAAVVLSGTWAANAGTFPGGGTAQAGETFIISVAGVVDGEDFNVNDRILAIVDNASTTVYANNWLKLDYTDAVLSVAGKTGAVTLAAADIASGTFADARVAQSNVTQHEAALTLTLSQISNAGTMASQNANAVAITGGSIDGVTLDGGTF